MKRKKSSHKKAAKSVRSDARPLEKGKISRIALLDEKKKMSMAKDEEKKISIFYALIIFFVVALVGVFAIFMNPYLQPSVPSVDEGDIAKIRYTGMLSDGTVFDSGRLTFRVGSGEVVDPEGVESGRRVMSGIDGTVTGMKPGESRLVVIQPEDLYSYYEPQDHEVVPLVEKLMKDQEMTTELFEMTFEEEPVVGKPYYVTGGRWPIKVTEISNDTVKMEYEVEEGEFDLTDVVGEVYGTYTIEVSGGRIIRTMKPVEDSIIRYTSGVGRISGVNQTHMVLEYFPIDELMFQVELVDFVDR